MAPTVDVRLRRFRLRRAVRSAQGDLCVIPGQPVEADDLIELRRDTALEQQRHQHRRAAQRRTVGAMIVFDLPRRVVIARQIVVDHGAPRP